MAPIMMATEMTVVEGHRGLESCSYRSIGIGTDIVSTSFGASLEGGDTVPLPTLIVRPEHTPRAGRRTQLTQTESETIDYVDARDEGGVNGI